MYGKNININYHYEVNFYYVIKNSVNFDTQTTQSLLNHK